MPKIEIAAQGSDRDPRTDYLEAKPRLLALVKNLVQRLNERPLSGRIKVSYCAEGGARKVHNSDTPSPTPTKQPKRRVFVGQKVGSESFWLVAL
jgi:hypothetical protein